MRYKLSLKHQNLDLMTAPRALFGITVGQAIQYGEGGRLPFNTVLSEDLFPMLREESKHAQGNILMINIPTSMKGSYLGKQYNVPFTSNIERIKEHVTESINYRNGPKFFVHEEVLPKDLLDNGCAMLLEIIEAYKAGVVITNVETSIALWDALLAASNDYRVLWFDEPVTGTVRKFDSVRWSLWAHHCHGREIESEFPLVFAGVHDSALVERARRPKNKFMCLEHAPTREVVKE
jgi:hypothetical protein